MKTYLVLLLSFVHALGVLGQTKAQPKDRCGTHIDYDKLRTNNLYLYNYLKEIDRKAAEYSQRKQNGQVSQQSIPNTATIVTIPVVVHVIHDGEAVGVGRNIADAQIQSQIDVLNEDFRRMNADRVNTPAEFAGVAADVGIQFRLACVDPNGNPTNGIRRVRGNQANYNVEENADGTINETTTGIKANDAPWNRNLYLNIWTTSMNGGVLGYATFPGSAANVDGVVVQFNAFGRTGNLLANFDRGRTATHEIGHWLSLIHIWGDDNGACTGTDNVADTPNQANSYLGQCPSGQRLSCGVSNMYQNYMDYTNDACMNLFSTGQSDRMKVLFLATNARSGFISWSDITGSNLICDGNTYSYSITSTGTSFSWTVSGNLTIVSGQGTNQITVLGNGSGPGNISVTSQGLCSATSVWVGVPGYFDISGPENICVNRLYQFNLTSNNFSDQATYTWSSSSANLSITGNSISVNVSSCCNGTYILSVASQNACGITNNSLGIDATQCFAQYRVYPNPASDQVKVEFEEVNEADSLPDEIVLLSEASSKPVKTVNVQETFSRNAFQNGNQIQIDVRNLARGRYYLHIKNSRRKDKEVDVIRIILE